MRKTGIKFNLSWIYVVLVILFLFLPLLSIFLLSFSKTIYLEFPPSLFSIQWYKEMLHNKNLLNSFFVSLKIATLSTLLATLLGTLAALGTRNLGRKLSNISYILFIAPLVVPYIILATGMSRLTILIDIRGIPAIALAHTVIALPYVFLLVNSSFHLLPESVEEAARVLGARQFTAIWKVTLPLIRPHILVATMFAFVASLGEFIIAYILSSPFANTLPVYIYGSIRDRQEPSVSALLTLVTVTVTFIGFFYTRLVYHKRR